MFGIFEDLNILQNDGNLKRPRREKNLEIKLTLANVCLSEVTWTVNIIMKGLVANSKIYVSCVISYSLSGFALGDM